MRLKQGMRSSPWRASASETARRFGVPCFCSSVSHAVLTPKVRLTSGRRFYHPATSTRRPVDGPRGRGKSHRRGAVEQRAPCPATCIVPVFFDECSPVLGIQVNPGDERNPFIAGELDLVSMQSIFKQRQRELALEPNRIAAARSPRAPPV